MKKKYIVRLSDSERETLQTIIKKLTGTSETVKRAHILLKTDVETFAWTDAKIAEAFSCRTQTIEKLRKRLVTQGFDAAINRKPQANPSRKLILDGQQEAKVIAIRLGPPPKGFANWSLRLLANRVVELEIIESISHETIRRTLKKMG